MLEEADTLDAFRRRVQGRRADRCRAARHGRLEPRARGLPPLLRHAPHARAAPARPRLDRAAADRGGRARDRRREDAVHRLHQVGRHDRDDLAVQALPRAAGRRLALRARHRPGLEPARPRRGERLPARVPERPRDRRTLLGAVVLRDRAGRAGGHRRAAAARGRAGRRAGLLGLRQPREQRRPVARPRARRARPRRPRQADVRGRRPDRLVRRLGRAARGREHRQAEPRHPPGRRRADPARRRLRQRPRLPPPPQHGRAGRRARRGASRRSPRPGTRR